MHGRRVRLYAILAACALAIVVVRLAFGPLALAVISAIAAAACVWWAAQAAVGSRRARRGYAVLILLFAAGFLVLAASFVPAVPVGGRRVLLELGVVLGFGLALLNAVWRRGRGR